jgi:hypothetical protein
VFEQFYIGFQPALCRLARTTPALCGTTQVSGQLTPPAYAKAAPPHQPTSPPLLLLPLLLLLLLLQFLVLLLLLQFLVLGGLCRSVTWSC